MEMSKLLLQKFNQLLSQDDIDEAAAMQLAQFDQNKLIDAYKIAQENQRFFIEERNKAIKESDKRAYDLEIKKQDVKLEALKNALNYQMNRERLGSEERQAGIRASASGSSKPLGIQERAELIDRELKSINSQLSDLTLNKEQAAALQSRRNILNSEMGKLIDLSNQQPFGGGGIGSGIQSVNPSFSKVLGAK